MSGLFGTDGIRGESNLYPMTPEVALGLGRALAAELRSRPAQGPGRPRIVIGKDTRLSGYIFEDAMTAGICAMGVDVLLCGPLPTPGIAFITRGMRADMGVVISASHNPYYDNGIKIFGSDGFKLPDPVQDRLEARLAGYIEQPPYATRQEIGKAYRIDSAWSRYVEFLKTVLPGTMTLDGMKIVVDCAHGAAYKVAPAVFEELGADVVAIGCEPDGTNINDGCGSLYPDRLAEAVLAHSADIGIALDGDADRVIVVDELGGVVDGDQLMAMSASWMHREGSLRKSTVVATVMSNLGLEIALRRSGIGLVRTAVGDRHVVDAMRSGGYNVGGEQSGHLIYLDHTSTGDGILAALKTLTVVLAEARPLSELASVMQRVPQVLLNFQVSHKPPLDELPDVQRCIRAVEGRLGHDGRVLVRYSGTESKARVMVEGLDALGIQAAAEEIAGVFKRAVGA